MNLWTATGAVVASALLPCAWSALRGTPERRLVGVQMASLILTIAMVLFTVGWDRPPYIDLPLTLAILSFGGGLVYARFLEKHL